VTGVQTCALPILSTPLVNLILSRKSGCFLVFLEFSRMVWNTNSMNKAMKKQIKVCGPISVKSVTKLQDLGFIVILVQKGKAQ